MKNNTFFRVTLAIAALATATSLSAQTLSLGAVSFATDKVWTVGGQTWSDAVRATGCDKNTYGSYNNSQDVYNADCRSNPGHKGSLFSWVAVVDNEKQLCPDGWRVPTVEDFKVLNVALGGKERSVDNTYTDAAVVDKLIKVWGGTYSGRCNSDGTLNYQGRGATYWSKSEDKLNFGFGLYFFSDGGIYPQLRRNKGYGFALRCVK